MAEEKRGIAVLFPGIGYTCDRSLLYFSGKLLQRMGYQVIPLRYQGFPANVKGDAQKMQQCFFTALEQTEAQLDGVDFSAYEDIIFVGKSIGTVTALQYARAHGVNARFVLLTPVEQTIQFLPTGESSAIVFHGTADPWARTEVITSACADRNIPLHVVAGANHSLETGDVYTDLANLQQVLEQIQKFAM